MTAARRAAVLGSPIAHSLSPVLHRAAYDALGLRDWTYDAVEITPATLGGFLDGLGPEWAGLSLTMPLKQAVIPLLDAVSAGAREVGAVNTVVLRDGRREGTNTDVPGFVAALRERGVTACAAPVVLGAGATAGSALAALAALGTRTATVVARRPSAAGPVCEVGARVGLDVEVVEWAVPGPALDAVRSADLVVATTPAGAADGLAAALAGGGAAPGGVLFDVVYAPWPTRLGAVWSSYGLMVLSGLDLLVHQAALQVPAFTGLDLDPAALVVPMRAAGLQALAAR
ncbi:MAG TPA: shikimate dehydrogenase [Actinomycetes bacterium]|nr:shikimate dehydrogenase [Actinomycetes bacterium]